MIRRHALLASSLLLALLVAGCVGYSFSSEGSGSGSISIQWGSSQKQCNNGDCRYGQNAAMLTDAGTCGPDPTVTWEIVNWVAGSVTVTILDPDGTTAFTKNLAGDQTQSKQLAGPKGEWSLKGETHDANGQLNVRLTCT